MTRVITLVASAAVAVAFGRWIELAFLSNAFAPTIVCLSIMAAAIFVRLNRGMPTLDLKSLKPSERERLTSSIVEVAWQYVFALAIVTITIIALVALSSFGVGEHFPTDWSEALRARFSAALGFALTLCLGRMVIIVWRDYDIVRLQKLLIDAAGRKEDEEKQAKLAEQKKEAMQEAKLRRVVQEAPKAWTKD